MGSKNSIDKSRKKYFKVIKKQREIYVKKNETAISSYDFKVKHM